MGSTMTDFLETARVLVGDDNVLEAGSTSEYADPYAFDEAFTFAPPGAVRPGSVEEVAAVVTAAVEASVSLWTVSRGRNLAYGGAMPADPASYVLDLGRLNRVREVNVESGYVVVEPGVSFFDLYEHLRANDIPLMMSVPDLGWGSLIGNALERGFGYSAHGEHGNYLAGLEVVLPSGEVVRTGMGALPDSPTAHLYKGGYGPAIDSLFQQSNFGVVVSGGIWLMPRPAHVAACLVSVPVVDDLAELVDVIRPLMLDHTIDGVVIVGTPLALVSHVIPRATLYDGPGLVPEPVLEGVMKKFGIGRWNAKFGLYGAPGVVAAKVEVLRARVASMREATLGVTDYPGDLSGVDVHPADRSILGIPSDDAIQMAAWRGGVPAHTDFSLVTGTTGKEVQQLNTLVRGIIESAGLDQVGGFTLFGRHAIMLSLLSFDGSSPHDRALVRRLFTELVTTCAARGYAPYRAHPAFMNEIADVYSFNDSALRRLVTTLKSAIDPTGVLSPGKQGIGALVARRIDPTPAQNS
jgi:4-cresol dehydrogenase (hydroxylating)